MIVSILLIWLLSACWFDLIKLTASELDAIRGLFNEKEKELAVAVAKVEELTKQLEQVQKGRGHHDNNILNTPAMMELEKLRKELAVSLSSPDFTWFKAWTWFMKLLNSIQSQIVKDLNLIQTYLLN